MIFVAECLQQDLADTVYAGFLEKFLVKEKFNESRAQYGMGKLKCDIRAFNDDIADAGFQQLSLIHISGAHETRSNIVCRLLLEKKP